MKEGQVSGGDSIEGGGVAITSDDGEVNSFARSVSPARVPLWVAEMQMTSELGVQLGG